MENNGILKGMLIALVALYVISPLDLAPGPVDDLLLLLFTVAANRKRSAGSLPPASSDDIPEK